VGIVWLAPSVSPGLSQSLDAKYRIVRPDGPGPHPAVVFVSGCDGFAPSIAPELYERRAEQFRGRGYAVVFADYLGRRGLKSCAGSVTHQDAARDLVAAAAWLTSQTFVDRARITAIGWSFGGRGVLVALAEHGKGHLAFSRAVVYYPDCRTLEPWKSTLPVLMLLGGSDDMTPPALCEEGARRSAPPGTVKIVVYPGAQHAFDVPELSAKVRYGLGTIGYHPQVAVAAWEEVQRFLGPVK
jgi:dienelactone hydrolase